MIAFAARAAALTISATLLCASSFAGQSCTEKPMTAQSLDKAISAAMQLNKALDASGERALIVARAGQDLSKYGLRYSHVGIAYKASGSAPWKIMELLNGCGAATSDLWEDGLANFFMDDPFSYDSEAMAPPPAVEAKLLAMLADPAKLRAMHGNRYSMVAYPFSTTYQNSNQWVLEVLASAESNAASMDRSQAQAWLKNENYDPTHLNIGPLDRLGARMFKANIAFDDHPNEQRFSDRIDTATVDSIEKFLRSRSEGWRFATLPAPKP